MSTTDPSLSYDANDRLVIGQSTSGRSQVAVSAIVAEAVKEASAGETVTSDQITDATTVGKKVLTAEDEAAARTAIGAGTSSLTLGTTATTALAGNTAIPAAATTNPAALAAAAAVGTSTAFARGDHVHAIPGASSGTTRGTVLIQAAIADLASDADVTAVTAKVNSLLAALRSAGIIAAS